MGSVFPPEWEMAERVAVKACETTRKQLADIMAQRSVFQTCSISAQIQGQFIHF